METGARWPAFRAASLSYASNASVSMDADCLFTRDAVVENPGGSSYGVEDPCTGVAAGPTRRGEAMQWRAVSDTKNGRIPNDRVRRATLNILSRAFH